MPTHKTDVKASEIVTRSADCDLTEDNNTWQPQAQLCSIG